MHRKMKYNSHTFINKRGKAMSNSLLLLSFIAFISLNVIDAVLTVIGNRRGYPELFPFTKQIIKEIGLVKAMVLKSLLPLPLVYFVIIGWDKAEFGFYLSFLFIGFAIFFFCVDTYDCVQLRKSQYR